MNTVKTTEKQQTVCGITTEMNQVIVCLLILNLLNTKQSIVGKTLQDNNSLTNARVVILQKHLSNFWRVLNIPLINCEVELTLTCSKNCVLADMAVDAAANLAIVAPSGGKFEIKDTKLYVPVVTLSKENNTKLFEQLKTEFKRTTKWNKYRSQMTIQPQNSNLNYFN